MSAVLKPGAFDWKNPASYDQVWRERYAKLRRIRERPEVVGPLLEHYRENPADFLTHWAVTADQRKAFLEPPEPVVMPFVLFPRQVEWVQWVLECARDKQPGLTEKSRDCGCSWLAMSLSATLCLLNRNLTILVGSATEDKVDRSGDPDCLLWKARFFLSNLPIEFRGGWDETKHSAHMRLIFPQTGSVIVGQCGDNIGRGGRSSIAFIDEAAFLDNPRKVDNALAGNTEVRIDISSVNGMANSFAEKRFSGRVRTFTFSWRQDPRKGEEWFAAEQRRLDPISFASQVDMDYHASTEGSLIPMAWAQAAVGAFEKLGLKPSGWRRGALDIADEGIDRNAFAGRHGQVLDALQSWSGKDKDILQSVQIALMACDERGIEWLYYDATGMGAGVRGDARVINEQRTAREQREIRCEPYLASVSPVDPDGQMIPGRKNADAFANLKSMSWWALRARFQATHRAIAQGMASDPDTLISIAPFLDELPQLLQELTQPTYSINAAGKIVINKTPAGFKSPNLADAVCICFAPVTASMEAWLRLV